jgi:hypothetical protein
MPKKLDAMAIAKGWQLNVGQARYSDWSNFYGLWHIYPAALLDAHGYVAFNDEASLRISGVKVTAKINVASGIYPGGTLGLVFGLAPPPAGV